MRSRIVYETTWGDNPDHAQAWSRLTLAVHRWLQEGWTPLRGVVIQERAYAGQGYACYYAPALVKEA